MTARGKHRRADFYPDDWLAGTLELTLEEEGAYIRVCSLIYSKGAPIPDNDRWLAGMCRVSARKWRTLRQALLDKGKITVEGGRIHQKRCTFELEKSSKKARKCAESGANGGRKSAELRANPLNDNEGDEANAQASRARTLLHFYPSYTDPNGSDGSSTVQDHDQDASKPAPIQPDQPGRLTDLRAVVFGECLDALQAGGIKEQNARSLLGKWRKAHGDAAVIDAVARAYQLAVSDPVPWITKALANGDKSGAGARPGEQRPAATRVGSPEDQAEMRRLGIE